MLETVRTYGRKFNVHVEDLSTDHPAAAPSLIPLLTTCRVVWSVGWLGGRREWGEGGGRVYVMGDVVVDQGESLHDPTG